MAKLELLEKLKKLFNNGQEVAHWFVTLSNGYDTAKQKMPGVLGLSKADERIFSAYSAELSKKENNTLTELLRYFPYDHQRRDFRLVVAGISHKKETKVIKKDGGEKDSEGKKARPVEEVTKTTETIVAINFLKKIVKMIDTEKYRGDGLEKAYQFCLAREIIHEDKMSRQAIEWTKKQIAGMFNVDSLSEIGAETLNEVFEPNKPAQKKLDDWLKRANNFRERCNR